jgi:hypothetical protein
MKPVFLVRLPFSWRRRVGARSLGFRGRDGNERLNSKLRKGIGKAGCLGFYAFQIERDMIKSRFTNKSKVGALGLWITFPKGKIEKNGG